MGIFDVVKDVAKVGAEILPIVLDNMAMGTQSRFVFGNSNLFDLRSINAILEGTGGAKANITLNSDNSDVTHNAETSLYEASVNLPDGFDPEPLISSIDLQVQIDEDAEERCLTDNSEMNKAFYALKQRN